MTYPSIPNLVKVGVALTRKTGCRLTAVQPGAQRACAAAAARRAGAAEIQWTAVEAPWRIARVRFVEHRLSACYRS